jgi:hypothetical protein
MDQDRHLLSQQFFPWQVTPVASLFRGVRPSTAFRISRLPRERLCHGRKRSMRSLTLAAVLLLGSGTVYAKDAASSGNCKVCSDRQSACMKNYTGPTCKTECQMCLKSCKK